MATADGGEAASLPPSRGRRRVSDPLRGCGNVPGNAKKIYDVRTKILVAIQASSKGGRTKGLFQGLFISIPCIQYDFVLPLDFGVGINANYFFESVIRQRWACFFREEFSLRCS